MASACERDVDVDVVIIGGGWAGIVMCKYALEVGLTVRVLEARDDIGGVWYYSDDPKHITVMRSTIMSSSASFTEMSDFPMPPEQGDFLTHIQVLAYLKSYCRKFDLRKHMEFNSPVASTQRLNDKWQVSTMDGRSYTATHVAVCSGLHQVPNTELKDTIFKDFTGEIQHSSKLKKFDESHRDKVVLILGGGETASDILDNWHGPVKRIIWSIPSGQPFFRKYGVAPPYKKAVAFDKASSVFLDKVTPHSLGKPGLSWSCRFTTNGSLLAYQGHGIPEFRNEIPYLRQFINKHAHVLNHLDYDYAIPKGMISSVHGNTVSFVDGTEYHVDNIILCTGYKETFKFLPQPYASTRIIDSYKFCLNTYDPTLAYIGFARPVLGSIPLLIELQSQMISNMWSGRVPLPDWTTRMTMAVKDKAKWRSYFSAKKQRIGALVDSFQYSKELMHASGYSPNFTKLFLESPRDFYTVLFAPGGAAISRVSDPKSRDQAVATMRHHSQDGPYPYQQISVILFRLLLLDWILDIIGYFKYCMQCNSTWKRVSKFRVVRAVDHVWTWPKRQLFDDQSHKVLKKGLKLD